MFTVLPMCDARLFEFCNENFCEIVIIMRIRYEHMRHVIILTFIGLQHLFIPAIVPRIITMVVSTGPAIHPSASSSHTWLLISVASVRIGLPLMLNQHGQTYFELLHERRIPLPLPNRDIFSPADSLRVTPQSPVQE